MFAVSYRITVNGLMAWMNKLCLGQLPDLRSVKITIWWFSVNLLILNVFVGDLMSLLEAGTYVCE